MKKKKILSFILSATVTASLAASSGLQSFADLYKENYDETLFNCIVDLYEPSISEYPEAQQMGVDKYILTEEGKETYEYIKDDQEFFKEQIALFLGYNEIETIYDYTAAFNGFSLTLTHSEYKLIKNNLQSLGIENITEISYADENLTEKISAKTSSVNPTYSYDDLTNKILEATGVTDTECDGENTVIAVIDTGFDRYHEFYSLPEGTNPRLTSNDINSVSEYLSASYDNPDEYYVSEKIPFAFNYQTKTPDTLSQFDVHGTHVAGIAAGNIETETDSLYNADGTASGAQLVLMAAYSLSGEYLLAAYDDCLYIGADVVNASYGISGITDNCQQTKAESQAITNMTNTGVIFCAAAGNDSKSNFSDIDYSSGGYPDNVNSVISVGSANNYIAEAKTAVVGEMQFEIIDSSYSISDTYINETYEYVPINGFGTKTDFKNLDLSGKIALVQRGNINFDEKAENALNAGAVGIIIYNSAEGDELDGINCTTLPSGFVSYNSGLQMIEAENKIITFTGTNVILKYDSEVMSDFSSWNFTENLVLKPDITGFGGNIISSVADENGEAHNLYACLNGTSMSTPQISGLMAILKQHIKNNPEKYEITSNSDYTEIAAKLLMSTATPIYTSDNLEIASPRVQGNGLANVSDAINTPCYISTNSEADQNRPKLSLGSNNSGVYTFDFNIHNTSDTAFTYNLIESVFRDETDENGTKWNTQRLINGEDYSISFTDPSYGVELSQITVAPMSTATITAEIIISPKCYNEIFEQFENGTFIDGFITLSCETAPSLTLSYMGFCGDWTGGNNANLIHSFAYKDSSDEFGSILHDGTYIAGVNYIKIFDDLLNGLDTFENPELSQPYFSPVTNPNETDNSYNNLYLDAYFTRRCHDVKATIYDSDGSEVYSEILGDGIMCADENGDLSATTFEISWNFRNNDGQIENNARYSIWLSAKAPLSDKYSRTVQSQTIIIDTEKPTIKKCSKLHLGNAEYLMIEATDNGCIQGSVSYESKNSEIYDYSPSTESSGTQTLFVELPDSSDSYVEVYDMAGNYQIVYPEEATQDIYLMSKGELYYTSDESSFKNKICFIDENKNEVKIPFSFNTTPSEAYENGESEITLLIDGNEFITIEVEIGLLGDANGDGMVNVRDASYIARMLANRNSKEYKQFINSINCYCADYNKDSSTNVRDASLIAHDLAVGKLH